MGSSLRGRSERSGPSGKKGKGREVGSRKNFLLRGITYLEREEENERERASGGVSERARERHTDRALVKANGRGAYSQGSHRILWFEVNDCWNYDSKHKIMQISSKTLTL